MAGEVPQVTRIAGATLAELKRQTDEWLVFDTPLRGRVAWLAMLATGLGVIVFPLASLARGRAQDFPNGVAVGVVGCTLFGALFVSVGFAMARGDGRLVIDLVDGSYRYRRRLTIRPESISGSTAEFSRLALEQVMVPTEDGSYPEWRVNLVWKDPDRVRYTLARRAVNPREARQLLAEYAAILKLPAVIEASAADVATD